MALEQHPDCFSARVGNQLALDGLLDYQTDSPTRPPCRRFAADHRDDALFLGIVQQRLGARPLPIVESAIQAAAVITVSDLANGFGSERQCFSDSRRGGSLSEPLSARARSTTRTC